jgi:hypothetical protein
MKKFTFLAAIAIVLTVFNGCQKDELKTPSDDGIAKTGKADVYLENGYLAFKNMNAVDSVINLLSKMSRNEKDLWEQKNGFKSARSEFYSLFDEYEKLTSKDEFLKFKAKNATQLKFNEMDETDCSIDYPYECTYYASIMNNKGIFKIGRSLFKQTLRGQVIALDGDMRKLDNPSAFPDDKTIISPSLLKSTSAEKNESILINDFAAFDPSGNSNRWWINSGYGSDRKLLNELKVNRWVYWNVTQEPRRLTETIIQGYRVFLRQYGLKKGTFGWNTYNTSYTCQNLNCQIDGGPINNVNGAISISPEVKPEHNWEIKYYETTYSIINYYISDPSYLNIPSIRMEADLSCRGFEGRITHVNYNLPFQ